jgi:hypothetical protein
MCAVVYLLHVSIALYYGPGKTLNSAVGVPARVLIPVPPSATSRLVLWNACMEMVG